MAESMANATVNGREVYYIPRLRYTMRYNRSIPLGEEACEMCASTTVSINKLTLSETH